MPMSMQISLEEEEFRARKLVEDKLED